jgi:hypothetical protein
METTSKYEKQILEDIRGLPPSLLPKISKLIHFVKDELLGEIEKQSLKNKNLFVSLEGVFQGEIEHTDEEIRAAHIKLKEV